MKIEKRPWKPQDLLDDLQSIIDEEPDRYLNTMRSTLCMARDYLKEFFSSPPNDPLTLEQLREMDGEPVWWEDKYERAGYGIISISEFDKAIYIVAANGTFVAIAHGEMNKHLGLTLFRRRPEEGTT